MLWEAALSLHQEPTPPSAPQHHSIPVQMTGTRPGEDFNARGRDVVRKTLQKHGWKYLGQRGDNDEKWQRPGTDDGHSAYLHITPPVFYPFSTNSHPFASDKRHKFVTQTQLIDRFKHGVDKRLREEAIKNLLATGRLVREKMKVGKSRQTSTIYRIPSTKKLRVTGE